MIRLQKFLAHSGLCSRRQGEKYIKDGLIQINGQVITEPGTKVDPVKDRVEFNKKRVILQEKMVYIALNKPKGYITSCSHHGEKIVTDLVNNIKARIFPIGRLDKDSTGLLLLTNDGRLHHFLSHPSFDHEKEYDVTVQRPLSTGALSKMELGMSMLGSRTRPAVIQRLSSTRFKIILKEGKNRQIRRMVSKVGGQVKSLKRIRVSGVRLKNLPVGTWRYLTPAEIKGLVGPLDKNEFFTKTD